jgi:hypothetical protein
MRFQATRVTRVHPNAGRELARLAAVRQNVLQSPTEAAPPTRRRSAWLHHPSAAVRAQDRLNAPFIARSKRGPEWRVGAHVHQLHGRTHHREYRVN